MSLEDLVTSTLPAKKQQQEKLRSLATNYADPTDLLRDGRDAEIRIASSSCSADDVRELLSPLVARHVSIAGTGRADSQLAVALLDFLQGGSRHELHQTLRRINNRLEMFLLLASPQRMIDYLQDAWGEEANEHLASFTRTRQQTVEGWLRDGKRPSDRNSDMILALGTLLYQLRRECGMTLQEAKQWIQNSQFSGQSLQSILVWNTTYAWGARDLPGNVVTDLVQRGADLEALQVSFNRYFLT